MNEAVNHTFHNNKGGCIQKFGVELQIVNNNFLQNPRHS